MSASTILSAALLRAKQIHEDLMPLSAVVLRPAPALGTDGRITENPGLRGTTALDINPPTVNDAKLVKMSGIEITAPYLVARLPLGADVEPDDVLVVGMDRYLVRGVVRPTARSVIRRAFVQLERK